jgi:anion-transporting  ArsA/GET3 family ATPase
MAVLETEDLIDSLKKLKVTFEQLVINKIIPENKCSFCQTKRAEQAGYIKELKRLKLKTIGVELFDKEIKGKDLNKLRKALYQK